jgi:hypothetical protein
MDETMQIKDLSPDQLAEYAHNGWVNSGLTPKSWRLVYLGLSKDLHHARLLQLMADTFVELAILPPAITFKFMQSHHVELDEWRQQVFDLMFASAMWTWGLSTRKDGGKITRLEEFENPDLFDTDRSKLDELIQPMIDHYGGLLEAMIYPLIVLGFNAAAILPKNPDQLDQMDHPVMADFKPHPDYLEFLEQPVEDLGEDFLARKAD